MAAHITTLNGTAEMKLQAPSMHPRRIFLGMISAKAGMCLYTDAICGVRHSNGSLSGK